MRWLIAIYTFIGIIGLGLASALVALGIAQTQLMTRPGELQKVEEHFLVAGIMALTAALPLFAAFGLWKRWRLMRLVLLVISWWSLIVSVLAALSSIAIALGLVDAETVGLDQSHITTLAMAGSLIIFSLVHIRLLNGRNVS